MSKLKCIFLGTPDFSVPSLDILHNHPLIDLRYVISMPDRKSGRGMDLHSPEVIQYAKANKISYFQTSNINKEEEFLSQLEQEKIDIVIVLAFAQFLGVRFLQLPSKGCFNIHTSLLPKYRGAAPIQYAILSGDTSTGVSIQKMVKKMDAGDICLSQPVDIHHSETGGQLYTRLKYQAALSLNELIYQLADNTVKFTPQDEADVSFAPTLKRDDGHLKFTELSAEDISNKVRGLFPWPGTYCFLGRKRLKIFEIELANQNLKPGEVSTQYGQIVIGTTTKSVRLKHIQLEGKKACLDTELLNGFKQEFEIH